MPRATSSYHRYRFDEFELRPDQGELARAGRPVPIQPQPLKVLTILVARAGDLVRRSELFAEVWGEDTHVDFDRGLNYCIRQIRTALGDDAAEPSYIRTVPRYGYRFIAGVHRQPIQTPSKVKASHPSAGHRVAATIAAGFALLLLALALTWWLATASSKPSISDTRALQEFLRGQHLAASGSDDDAVKSLEHFELAVAIAPSFARGHLAVAKAWMRVPGDPAESVSRSRAAVLRALELDANLAEAHTHLAAMKLYGDWDWKGAEDGYRRAVELEPATAGLRHEYASYLALMGRHEQATAQIERAMELDPISTSIKADAGWFYYQARRFEDAARLCELTLELDPENRNALWCLLQSRRHAGHDRRAIAAAVQLAALIEPEAAPAISDLEGFWRWYVGWLERSPENASPSWIGLGHLALGAPQRALELFEQAYEDRSSCLLSLAADPQLDPLRGHPRFDDLIAKLNLPH